MAKQQLMFGSLALAAGFMAFASTAVLADTASPKDTYLKYRSVLAKAKDVKEICPFLCKRTVEQINQTPDSDKPMMFGLIKDTSPVVVQVSSEEVKDKHASLKLSGQAEAKPSPSIQEKTVGTVTLVKENDEWKIDRESWNSTIKQSN